jgi:hypothetical protein
LPHFLYAPHSPFYQRIYTVSYPMTFIQRLFIKSQPHIFPSPSPTQHPSPTSIPYPCPSIIPSPSARFLKWLLDDQGLSSACEVPKIRAVSSGKCLQNA